MNAKSDRSDHDDPAIDANPGLADDPVLLEVWRRIRAIEDPCHVLADYPLTLVDLGVINRVDLDQGYVEVGLTYTEIGCTFAPRILQRLEEEVMAVPGIDSMDVVYEPFPPWSPDRMSPRAQRLYAQRRVQAKAAVAMIPLSALKPRRDPTERT
jgi:metal-sulfur cluster biosynthetic enzyme